MGHGRAGESQDGLGWNGLIIPEEFCEGRNNPRWEQLGWEYLSVNPSLCLSFLVGSCNPAGLVTADPSLTPVSAKSSHQPCRSFCVLPFYSLWAKSFLKHSRTAATTHAGAADAAFSSRAADCHRLFSPPPFPQGSCACRAYVEGPACDRCKPLYWNLTPENPYGCMSKETAFARPQKAPSVL